MAVEIMAIANLYLNTLGTMVGLPEWLSGKEPACNAGAVGDSDFIPGWGDPLEEMTAIHPNILAWRTPGTEEHVGLWSLVPQRAGHD